MSVVKYLVTNLPQIPADCLLHCQGVCDEFKNESWQCPLAVWEEQDFDKFYNMHECKYLAKLWIEHGYGNSEISEDMHYGIKEV